MNKLDAKQGEWIDYLYETYPDHHDVINDLKLETESITLRELVEMADGYDITETVGDLADSVMKTYDLDCDGDDEDMWSDLCYLIWDYHEMLDTTDVETDVKKLLGE